jgi:3-deoxy-manno-octulosonate cytidylyltransferase (CMP-KDO synthetase)
MAVAIIPARYGSKRFPGKPLALIAGRPMIQHVYERALSCPELSQVFVATDDERISRCVNDFGGEVVMTRKEHPTGTDRIVEAARLLKLRREDVVVNIQGDQPLFRSGTIADLIKPLLEDSIIDMSTLKHRIAAKIAIENPNHVKVVTDRDGFALYFSRSPIPFYRDRTSERTYYKHLGVYAYRNHFLETFVRLPQGQLEIAEQLEQLRALEHGYRIKVVESLLDSMEVDVPEDIETVEALMTLSEGK